MQIEAGIRKMIEGSHEEIALGLNEGVVGSFIADGGKTKFLKNYQVLDVPVSETERRIIVADMDADTKRIDVEVIFGKKVIGEDYVVIRENGMIGRRLFSSENPDFAE